MTDTTAAFIDEMRKFGCAPADPSEILDDDKRRRYQLDGDKRGVKNASYQLKTEPDGFAVGWFQSFKEGETHKWHSKANRKATDAERKEWQERLKAAKAEREKAEKEAQDKAANEAQAVWKQASAEGSNAYLEKKGHKLHGARMHDGKVVIPIYGAGGIVGMQTIDGTGFKKFNEGLAMKGGYFPIADKNDDKSTMLICEGWATGAALRDATGMPVVVAFNAGNLKPVAQMLAKKYPETRFVIAADNDQWTTNQKDEPWNVGIEKAHQAAVAIGGATVVAPDVPEDDPDKRTDWDDVYRTDGPEVVKQAFILPEPAEYDTGVSDEEYMAAMYGQEPDEYEPDEDPMAAIRPLGHSRGEYSFFPIRAGQIVTLTASALGRMQSLYMLAPRAFWEAHYGGEKVSDSQICAYASAHLMEICHQKGVFQLENARGVGAWMDNGEPVINCGDLIIGAGMQQHPATFHGEAVYESGPRVVKLGYDALTNKEASKLRDVCRMLSWRRPQYADMLAGWLVIATIGSALRWRPHIWITGRSGAGKSTVLDEIIKPILGDIAIKRDGGTSEAGVRKALGVSGRPYVLDEAESETKGQRIEMEKIISLARRASSGGVVENANATFQVRSCFCFAGINPRVEHVADRSRITQLELIVDADMDRRARYNELMGAVHETITDTYSRRLMQRTIENIDTLLHNIAVFSGAAAEIFGNNKRSGDQIGPMLAGAYLLTSTKKADPELARDWIAKQDWNWHTTINEESDSAKLVTHIMTSRIRYDNLGITRESTIGDLVSDAADKHSSNWEAAGHALRSYGIRVDGDEVFISNSAPSMRKLLTDTPYIPWGRTLGDYPNSHNNDNKALYFMAGLTTKVTALPLDLVLGKTNEIEDEELPFG